jgi:DNA-binding ferritin-like protein (Dps family)
MVILACGKHPTDADINPLLEERLERFYEEAVIEGIAKQMHSLTDDEVKSIINNLLEDDPTPLLTLADVIQEKLKEKNERN